MPGGLQLAPLRHVCTQLCEESKNAYSLWYLYHEAIRHFFLANGFLKGLLAAEALTKASSMFSAVGCLICWPICAQLPSPASWKICQGVSSGSPLTTFLNTQPSIFFNIIFISTGRKLYTGTNDACRAECAGKEVNGSHPGFSRRATWPDHLDISSAREAISLSLGATTSMLVPRKPLSAASSKYSTSTPMEKLALRASRAASKSANTTVSSLISPALNSRSTSSRTSCTVLAGLVSASGSSTSIRRPPWAFPLRFRPGRSPQAASTATLMALAACCTASSRDCGRGEALLAAAEHMKHRRGRPPRVGPDAFSQPPD
mmetsp:Transcript_35522/g.100548  ORF Transcript_35522/g.100548 Transcript_35522/m.100548 type:complete len:317 (-) Transcript_35522:288-1238(-)